MIISYIWLLLFVLSFITCLFSGSYSLPASALMDGAKAAVDMCIQLCGALCFWSGIMEVMRRSRISDKIAEIMQPFLSWLMPNCHDKKEIMDSESSNVAANLLGLGNAATPLGIKTVTAMAKTFGSSAATNDMCMFIVLNTASIQLLPTTVAAIRSSCGAQSAFDILPAVWITSIASVSAGIASAKLMAKFFK